MRRLHRRLSTCFGDNRLDPSRNGRIRLVFSFFKRVPGRRVPTTRVVRVSSTAPVDETYLRPTLPYPMKRTPVDPSAEPDQPWTRLSRRFALTNVNHLVQNYCNVDSALRTCANVFLAKRDHTFVGHRALVSRTAVFRRSSGLKSFPQNTFYTFFYLHLEYLRISI